MTKQTYRDTVEAPSVPADGPSGGAASDTWAAALAGIQSRLTGLEAKLVSCVPQAVLPQGPVAVYTPGNTAIISTSSQSEAVNAAPDLATVLARIDGRLASVEEKLGRTALDGVTRDPVMSAADYAATSFSAGLAASLHKGWPALAAAAAPTAVQALDHSLANQPQTGAVQTAVAGGAGYVLGCALGGLK